MSRLLRAWPVTAALAILMIACFHRAFLGEQFSYRDAAHFYYPLYQRVQMEWDAGRWPLWEPEENSGMPLLGNPTAAVLYPGKLIYALLPYPLAARTYVIVHVLISVAGAYLLARQFGISQIGAGLTGLSYAFAAPILFQYCNIIFLVGGAWTPFALRSADRWVREKKRWAILELGVLLALQVLGGDPQSAYMVGLCSGGYALALAWGSGQSSRLRTGSAFRSIMIALGVLVVWTAMVLVAASVFPRLRPPANRPPTPTFVWSPWVSTVVLAFWGVIGLVGIRAWARKHATFRSVSPGLVGLAAAAGLAGAISAAQLLPVIEFTRLTGRSADEGAHDIYPFSLEPMRVLEFVFPNLFGTTSTGNNAWLTLLPPTAIHRIWVPSLYAGGLTLVLALAAAGFRKGPAWRGWMTAIVFISLLGSFGEFGGPLFWARRVSQLNPVIGKPDPLNTNSIRLDRQLRDGDGSFYWMLSVVLPGFQGFRYPSKLLSLTLLGLSVLAGAGLDQIAAGERKRAKGWALALGGLSLAASCAVVVGRGPILKQFKGFESTSAFGPFQPLGALSDLNWAVFQAFLVFTLSFVLIWIASKRPRIALGLAPLVLALDLALANSHCVLTAPQAEFDAPSKYLQVIEEAERANPSPGPYRIHRMPVWNPAGWTLTNSTERVREFLNWERDTLQPKYGITRGVEYTYAQGTAELFDYEWFFGPFDVPVTPALARQLGKIGTHERAIYYPRRGFDLWNTRYFILPGYTVWADVDRGVASLLLDTEPLYPTPTTFSGPDRDKKVEAWLKTEDVQIVRNRNFMPRAWIIHQAWFKPPIKGLSREQRARPMEEMTFANDSIWHDPNRVVHDPRREAWIEDPAPQPIQEAILNTREHSDEYVRFIDRSPQRVELEAKLVDNGIVVLAETFYPGWKLTIDGEPATILRTNRLMRGALVKGSPQPHRLIYTYDPPSFRIGLWLSGAGLISALGVGLWAWRGSVRQPSKAGSLSL